MSKFQINGAVPITKDYLDEVVGNLHAKIMTSFNGASASDATSSPRTSTSNSAAASASSTWNIFYWRGKYRVVPEEFELPRDGIVSLFHLWHAGNVDRGIRPYRMITQMDLSRQSDKVRYCTLLCFIYVIRLLKTET
jgi:hypothetical protein